MGSQCGPCLVSLIYEGGGQIRAISESDCPLWVGFRALSVNDRYLRED